MRGSLIALAVALPFCGACGAKSTDLSPVGTGTQRVTVVTGSSTQSFTMRQDDAANVQVVDHSVDVLWKALPAVYEEMGISVTTVNPASKLIGADGVKLRKSLKGVPLSRYFDCGQTQIGPNADDYEITLTLLTRLMPASAGSSKVEVTTVVTARPVARRQNPVNCVNLGNLDSKFLAALKAAAASGR
jgi:hypothetical protein